MGELIDDLLSLSRIGRKPAEMTAVDMAALAQEVFTQLMSQQPNRSVAFHVQPLPLIEADLPLMRQVLTNLLSNAIKFTGHRVDAEITLGSQAAENETIYFVQDNGAGFDMRYIGKLFGVFQRLHNETDFEGTGVGLAQSS
jgi:light-regulated signal transduction histidine kinase (bacteriophytochrome)